MPKNMSLLKAENAHETNLKRFILSVKNNKNFVKPPLSDLSDKSNLSKKNM